MQKIIIEVDKNSKVTVETSGFKGEACKNITEELIKAIGSVEKTTDKDELFEQPVELDLTQSESE